MSSSDELSAIEGAMAPWICELCAHFMVLSADRTTSPSSCARSNRGHRLVRYTGSEQAMAIRQER